MPGYPEKNPVQKAEDKEEQAEEIKPTVLMSELDAVIHEKIKSQPKGIESIVESVPNSSEAGLHRMSLPPYFEQFSYDCTRGEGCDWHKRKGEETTNRGKYILRWIFKDKRAIDYSMNVRGWFLANRMHFPGAPKELFSANGAVEIGDSVLAFMPVEKALRIRRYPSERSKRGLESRMTPSRRHPKRVLMTGNPDSGNFYEPDLSQDESEEGLGSGAAPGSLQEGRDF